MKIRNQPFILNQHEQEVLRIQELKEEEMLLVAGGDGCPGPKIPTSVVRGYPDELASISLEEENEDNPEPYPEGEYCCDDPPKEDDKPGPGESLGF